MDVGGEEDVEGVLSEDAEELAGFSSKTGLAEPGRESEARQVRRVGESESIAMPCV